MKSRPNSAKFCKTIQAKNSRRCREPHPVTTHQSLLRSNTFDLAKLDLSLDHFIQSRFRKTKKHAY